MTEEKLGLGELVEVAAGRYNTGSSLSSSPCRGGLKLGLHVTGYGVQLNNSSLGGLEVVVVMVLAVDVEKSQDGGRSWRGRQQR